MVVEELDEEVELAGLGPVRDQGGAVGVGWWEGVGGGGGGGGILATLRGGGRTGGGEAVLAGKVEEVGLLTHCGVVEVWRM